MPQLHPHYILARVEAICQEVEAIEFRHSALWQELAELRDQLRDAADAIAKVPTLEATA